MRFTYGHYSKMLETLLKTHRPTTYKEMNTSAEPSLIIRHDIDYGLEFIGEMPRIEAEIGIRATYFIQVSSIFYNFFSPPQVKQIRCLENMGHRFGLHSDSPSNVPKDKIVDFIGAEMRLLKEVCKEVDAVSFHQPPDYIVENTIKIPYLNKYDKVDMSGFTYMSDSAGRWSKDDPIDFLRAHPGDSLQMLVHPVLWGEEQKPFQQRALGSILCKADEMSEYLNRHARGISCRLKCQFKSLHENKEIL